MKNTGSLDGDMYNSDVFQILFDYEIARSRRYPSPLTLIQLEMKATAMSAEALSEAPGIFSSALNRHLRSVDIPSKAENIYTLLLPNSSRHGAYAVCERLLYVFKNKLETSSGDSIVFSLNIGATTHAGGADITSESVLQKAGEALKKSKRKGANTYVFLE